MAEVQSDQYPQIQQSIELLQQAAELIKQSQNVMGLSEILDDQIDDAKTVYDELAYNLNEIQDSIQDSVSYLGAIGANGESFENIDAENSEEVLDDDEEITAQSSRPSKATDETPIKYAPRMPVYKGEKTLASIRIVWASGGSDSTGSVKKAVTGMISMYQHLSGGLLKIKPSYFNVKVPFKKSYKYVKAAAARGKNQAGKFNWYAVFTGGAAGVSRAGGNTATMRAPGTFRHEGGHLIGFGHASRMELSNPKFRNRPDIKGQNGVELNLGLFRTNSSADGSSVMSTFPSNQLTAPQLYSKGWLKENQVAQHEKEDPARVYHLQTLNSGDAEGYVKSVMIPNARGEEGRSLFLSAIHVRDKRNKDNSNNAALTLHLGNPSSIRIITFGMQPTTVLGHTFEALKRDGNFFDVKISPVPKPSM